jgi:NAD-dependent deacetylase
VKLAENFLDIVRKSRYAVVLTGAGVSVESGVPTFRGKDGLWSKYDPDEYATKEAFERDPVKVWRWLAMGIELILKVEPNMAHIAIAELESLGYVKSVITQNIDNLHQKAGSKNVIEVHGNTLRLRCTACSYREIINMVPNNIPPYCPKCDAMLRPDVVLFGEALPYEEWDRAVDETSKADVYIVVGTSGVVMPAAMLPLIAKGKGAFIIEINPEVTSITRIVDLYIDKKAGEFFSEVMELLSS